MRTKRLLATVVAGCAVAAPVVAYAGTAVGTAPALAAKAAAKGPTKAEVTKGKALYASKCSSCHGPKGEGTAITKNMPYSKLPLAKSVAGVIKQIKTPNTPTMPADLVKSATEQKEVAAYVTVDLAKTVKVAK